ncbi:MAG TPA: hypothetical protein VNV87_07445 [Acidimicrobiales bacterium]|nr:hypothetical protein [Acidimicrobiales bacterium]
MRLLSIERLTHDLPLAVTPRTLRRWISCGDFPAWRCGRAWTIDPDCVVAVIAATRSGPPGESAIALGDFVTERVAAGRLGVAVVTLARWRAAGTSPVPWYRLGNSVLYVDGDIAAIVAAQRPVAA